MRRTAYYRITESPIEECRRRLREVNKECGEIEREAAELIDEVRADLDGVLSRMVSEVRPVMVTAGAWEE